MQAAPSPPRLLRNPRALVFGVILAAMLFSSVYPLGRYFAVRNQVAQLEQEEQRLDDRIVQLMEEQELLNTPEEIERIARKDLLYVRPGEIPFVVLPGSNGKKE